MIWSLPQKEPPAVEKGNKYVLNGVKQFITNGEVADIVLVIAVTNQTKKEIKFMKGAEAVTETALRVEELGYFGYPVTPQMRRCKYLAYTVT